MGIYLNPGAGRLGEARNSKIYVDKSGQLLPYLDSVAETLQKFVCVSRPRRFGKTMAADMICAYYDRTVNRAEAFAELEIASAPGFDTSGNRYDVIRLNMVEFLQAGKTIDEMIDDVTDSVEYELTREYPWLVPHPRGLGRTFDRVYVETRRRFVFVIDEWDCVMREMQHDPAAQGVYLDWLRALLKDKEYVALAYLTGILPIKKYGKHSALNMFDEFSMTGARQLAASMGFTDAEVRALCAEWGRPYDEARAWYDGYRLANAVEVVKGEEPRGQEVLEVYSPRSIVAALTSGVFDNYWNKTETYEALKAYIDMDFDGLRDAVIALLAGDRRTIDIATFANDMTTFATADDVLTLLVHLGYLGYDQLEREVFMPNREIAAEFASSVRAGGWDEVARAVRDSAALLEAIVAGDEGSVAAGVEAAHQETSHLAYNDENALAYTLSLGLYAARQWYDVIRELPAGKGFADLVLVPRRAFAGRPAIVAELKWDEGAETAIAQIHDRRYPDVLAGWMADGGEVVLAGVSYDKKTREHSCVIERL